MCYTPRSKYWQDITWCNDCMFRKKLIYSFCYRFFFLSTRAHKYRKWSVSTLFSLPSSSVLSRKPEQLPQVSVFIRERQQRDAITLCVRSYCWNRMECDSTALFDSIRQNQNRKWTRINRGLFARSILLLWLQRLSCTLSVYFLANTYSRRIKWWLAIL